MNCLLKQFICRMVRQHYVSTFESRYLEVLNDPAYRKLFPDLSTKKNARKTWRRMQKRAEQDRTVMIRDVLRLRL